MKDAAPMIPAELAQEVIKQPIEARSAAMGSIAGELKGTGLLIAGAVAGGYANNQKVVAAEQAAANKVRA